MKWLCRKCYKGKKKLDFGDVFRTILFSISIALASEDPLLFKILS